MHESQADRLRYTVVILSKNDHNLQACVSALRAAGETCPVIVVDDGLSERRDDCEYIAGEKPFIFARNANIGIRHAASDVVLLNDDALLESEHGFRILAEAAAQNPEYGLIGATTNVTGQAQQWRQKVGLREVEHFAFVCVYIPKHTQETVGLLDERYCLDYGVEDRDLCHAVRVAGLKCGVHDDCYVDHGSLVSTFRGNPHTPKDYRQNLALFREKWGFNPR